METLVGGLIVVDIWKFEFFGRDIWVWGDDSREKFEVPSSFSGV